MRFGLQKALLLPGILCLVVILAGIAVGDDNETYGAYAGAPQSVTDQTPAAATSQTGEPVSLLGFAGQTAITATYTTQAPPVTEQKVLLNYDVQTAPPTAVYYSGTFMPCLHSPRLSPQIHRLSGWHRQQGGHGMRAALQEAGYKT